MKGKFFAEKQEGIERTRKKNKKNYSIQGWTKKKQKKIHLSRPRDENWDNFPLLSFIQSVECGMENGAEKESEKRGNFMCHVF